MKKAKKKKAASKSPFDSVESVIADIRRGKMVIVVDDEDRENEGDLIMAAEHAKCMQMRANARNPVHVHANARIEMESERPGRWLSLGKHEAGDVALIIITCLGSSTCHYYTLDPAIK